jgi:putative thiamine transport system ATP-binding protein
MADGLVLDHLCIELGARRLVELDVRIAPGETLTLMGPSGIGKSTVLAAITGTLAPSFRLMGRVRLDGRDITDLPTEARRVGILFQDELLFPHLSVGGNLGFGLPARVPDRKARIEAALAEVGLAGFSARDPATLSGGQKARVALMRMLLSEPKALLLDEPFSRLDTALRAQTRETVFALAQRRGLPTLLVTHDAEDARAAGGRILALG